MSGFTGFSAFASHKSIATSAVQLSQGSSGGLNANNSKFIPSPICTNSDQELVQIFKKIAKKDFITKSRALVQLVSYCYPCSKSGAKDDDPLKESQVSKSEQISALSHFLYLFANRLIHDNNPSVRSEAIHTLGCAIAHVPKACIGFLTNQTSSANVIGWVYSSQSSQTSEESKISSRVWKQIDKLFSDSSNTDQYEFICRHIEFILENSSRAGNLNIALSGNKSKAGISDDGDLDEMEERYERVIMITLRCSVKLSQQHPKMTFQNPSVLWKHLNSTRASFRRATYQLLTHLCQYSPFILHTTKNSNISQLMLNALSAERDGANFGSLFEMVLLYISSFRTFGEPKILAWNTDASSEYCKGMDINTFIKAVSKALRKACYGGSVSDWGRTQLPILALLPTIDDQIHFVASLWTGRTSSIGTADSILIVAAVTECCMYILMRESSNSPEAVNQEQKEVALDVAQMFLDCMMYYLTLEYSNSSSLTATKELLRTIVRDTHKLNAVPEDKRCYFNVVRNWFWNEGFFDTIQKAKLYRLRDLIDGFQDFEKDTSILLYQSSFKFMIHRMLPSIQKFPNPEEVLFMKSLFRCHDVLLVFGNDRDRFHRFCLDQSLAWTSHASGADAMNREDSQSFFSFILLVLNKCPDVEMVREFWKLYFSENYACRHSLKAVNNILCLIPNEFPRLGSAMMCDEFEKFAEQTAKASEDLYYRMNGSDHTSDHKESERFQDYEDFLNSCFSGYSVCPLIGKQCIATMKSIAIQSASDHPDCNASCKHVLLSALLLHMHSTFKVLSDQESLDLLLISWREGGPTWTSSCAPYLSSCDNLTTVFVEKASSISRSALSSHRNMTVLSDKLRKTILTWADRCHRLLSIQSHIPKECSYLNLVGLGDLELWNRAYDDEKLANWLLLCLSGLLQTYHTSFEREKLFRMHPNGDILFMHILLTSVQENSDISTKCEHLLGLLGEAFFNFEELIFSLIFHMNDIVKSNDNLADSTAFKNSVILLDWMVGKVLPKYMPLVDDRESENDDIDMNDVKEGDELFYVADDPTQRVKVRVLRVHRDDFPNLYFSIEVPNENQKSETPIIKQTIASRLKRRPEKPNTISNDCYGPLIRRIEEQIVGNFINSNLTERCPRFVAELLNTVTSYCGFQSKGGIGSVRFKAFQTFSILERRATSSLNASSVDSAAHDLSNIACALGYGILTSFSELNCKIMQYNCDSINNSLNTWDETKRLNSANNYGFCKALVMWITVSARASITDENASFLWTLLEHVTRKVDESLVTTEMMVRALASMNAASLGLSSASRSNTIAAEEGCATALILRFSDEHEACASFFGQFEVPRWYEPLKCHVKNEVMKRSHPFIEASRICAEKLLRCLDIPIKRWSAFHMIFASSQEKSEAFGKDEVRFCKTTESNLMIWQKKCDEEQSIELQEDVLISGQWLPSSLMEALEKWQITPLHHEEEDSVDYINECVSRLLKWLIALEILDTAGSVDMRNRTHINSYIEQTGALSEVFDIAIRHLNLENMDPNNMFRCISIQNQDDSFCLYQLSTLVVFRTMESMPTLCKSWWNEDCSRSLQARVTKFVEISVAPKTLERELQRIDDASVLGDLDVQGSCISREVVATYVQDECKLSVKIRIPSTFPLRNVEVDCTNTLGVNEKRWRRWALQIMCMLNSQDGSILDALLLWKQNVDKEFEGIEPCPVCYSVLSVKTHEMPNLECKTCHNRFHTSCLYKWFNSSGKNQCVLCQQPWSGTKVA